MYYYVLGVLYATCIIMNGHIFAKFSGSEEKADLGGFYLVTCF